VRPPFTWSKQKVSLESTATDEVPKAVDQSK